MRRNLWIRIGLVAAIVVLSGCYLDPPERQGGIHLVLRVDTPMALATQTDRAANDFSAGLERKGVGVKRVARVGDTAFVVELVSPDAWNHALTVANEFPVFEVTNRDQAADRFTMRMSDPEVRRVQDYAVRQTVETIRNRVDQFGVAAPTITRQGEDRILIQLPGVQDPERAKRARALITKTGLLEFKLVDDSASVDEALAGRLPDGDEIRYQRQVDTQTKQERTIPYVVEKRTLLTGAELSRADATSDPNSAGRWQIAIEFTPTGTRVFGDITGNNVGRRLAVFVDGTLYAAPPNHQAHSRGAHRHHRAVLRGGRTRFRDRATNRRAASARHESPGADDRPGISVTCLPAGQPTSRRCGLLRCPDDCRH